MQGTVRMYVGDTYRRMPQMVPLEAAPLYLVNSYPNHYWTAPRNTTEWHQFVKELTNAGNAIARLKLQLLAPTLSGAHIGEPPLPSLV